MWQKFDLLLVYCYPHQSDSSCKNVFLHFISTFICFLKSQTFHLSNFDAYKYELTTRECPEMMKSLFSNWVDIVKVIKVWTERPCWTSMSDISSVTKIDLMIIYLKLHIHLPAYVKCILHNICFYLSLHLFLKSQTFYLSKFDACKYEHTIRECFERFKLS